MKRRLGNTVYFDGEALGTIAKIETVEDALKITLGDGSSFFEPTQGALGSLSPSFHAGSSPAP